MKIKTVTVTNFRSLRSVVLEAASFNVFVGQNNHGKTNLFQAIEWFYSGKGEVAEIRHVDAGPKDEVMVEVEFVGVKDGIGRISNEDNQTKLRNIFGESDTMHVRRSSAAPRERLLLHPTTKQWKKQP